MNKRGGPRLQKHGGIWALRAAMNGRHVCRRCWTLDQYLCLMGSRFVLKNASNYAGDFSFWVSDLKAKDWVDMQELREYREAKAQKEAEERYS